MSVGKGQDEKDSIQRNETQCEGTGGMRQNQTRINRKRLDGTDRDGRGCHRADGTFQVMRELEI